MPTKSLWVFLAWWLAMSLSATGIVSLIYAVSRRLLPLGALLDLSLVFPDESPSRFKLALRTGTVESLEARLHELREGNERRARRRRRRSSSSWRERSTSTTRSRAATPSAYAPIPTASASSSAWEPRSSTV